MEILVWLALPAALLIYLIVVVFFPGFDFPQSRLALMGQGHSPAPALPFRQDIQFQVEGATLYGWFYQASAESAPCIVMATGLGGTREMGLEALAIQFREHGYHCLTFDYRHFGASEGQPRNLVWPRLQLEDLRGALQWAGSRSEIESAFIWGASAGGSYGIILAAEQDRFPLWPLIQGVVCQVPALDTKSELKGMIRRNGLPRFLRLIMHAQRDRGRGRLGLSPHYIPMVASGKGFAMLQGPGAEEGYASLASGRFENRICARSMLMPPPPQALSLAGKVHCPVLIQLASHDGLISPEGHQEVAKKLASCEIKVYEGGHFDLYLPPLSNRVVADQLDFFARCLNPKG
ncbi:MAG: hypothetical protein CMN76_10595 [Spirochaetaceae bacterium]|nr:hypothetical protein [Spirochaetaceae bacterium]|tara:strand:- start:11226 stop:12269 length:1044 start_codon:yes stop_codon:yes gene_type:complete